MNTKSNKRQHVWRILAILLFVFCLISVSGTTDTSASKLTLTPATESTTDPVRQHMLDIAYLYAHHRWQAAATNIIHPDGVDTNADAYEYTDTDYNIGNLKEQDHVTVKHVNGDGVLFRKDMFPPY